MYTKKTAGRLTLKEPAALMWCVGVLCIAGAGYEFLRISAAGVASPTVLLGLIALLIPIGAGVWLLSAMDDVQIDFQLEPKTAVLVRRTLFKRREEVITFADIIEVAVRPRRDSDDAPTTAEPRWQIELELRDGTCRALSSRGNRQRQPIDEAASAARRAIAGASRHTERRH